MFGLKGVLTGNEIQPLIFTDKKSCCMATNGVFILNKKFCLFIGLNELRIHLH